MLLSSDCIRSNPHSAVKLSDTASISIDDTFLTVDLLGPIQERTTIYRPPSTACQQCGAYLSSLTQSLVENEVNNGRVWCCVFCNSKNHSDFDIRSIPETKSMVYDLVFPSDESVTSSSSVRKCVLNVILCDSKLLSDEEDLFCFLMQSLSDTPEEQASSNIEQFVGIVFFDQVLRVPRLTSLISAEKPIEIDIFENKKPITTKRDLSFLQQGLHITSRHLLQPYLYRLREICEVVKHSVTSSRFLPPNKRRFNFASSRRHGSVTADAPASCIDGAFSLVQTLSAQLQATIQQAQVTFITSQSLFFTHIHPNNNAFTNNSNTPIAYNLFRIGARHMSCPLFLTECIDLSGGLSLTAESVTDAHFLCDSHRVFSPQFVYRACSLLRGDRYSDTQKNKMNPSKTTTTNNLYVWVSGQQVGVSVLTGGTTVTRPGYHKERYECHVSPVNNNSLLVTCQLYFNSNNNNNNNNNNRNGNKFNNVNNTTTTNVASSNGNWMHRTMKYLQSPTLSSTSTLLPTTSPTTSSSTSISTSNTSSDHLSTPPSTSSNSVSVMVAYTLPHCDYDTLSHWNQPNTSDSANNTSNSNINIHGGFCKVVRVITVSLPISYFTSHYNNGNNAVFPPYWTLHRTSLPLYLPPPSQPNKVVFPSNNTIKKSSISVTVSSGDLWVLGVAQMVSQHFETQVINATSDKDTHHAYHQCMQVIDRLAAQLMKRLCVLYQMYNALEIDSSTNTADDVRVRYMVSYDRIWVENMLIASYEALWGLYGYKTGPLWNQNQILAKDETALLNYQMWRNRGSLVSNVGMLRPRLWLLQPTNHTKNSGHSNDNTDNHIDNNDSEPDNNQGGLAVLPVSPETTNILSPETALFSAFFCGDFFSVNVLSDIHDQTDDNRHKNATSSQYIFDAILSDTLNPNSNSFPVTKSVFLEMAGTPRDRLIYSRLSPRHSDILTNTATNVNSVNTSDRSNIQDIIISVQDSYRVLYVTNNNNNDNNETRIMSTISNIRKDMELYLYNNNNETDVQRFHIRRHLPVVSDNALSFQRYLLSHVFSLLHANRISETAVVNVFAEQHNWKQILTFCEALALRTHAETHDLQSLYADKIHQTHNVIQQSTYKNANSNTNHTAYDSNTHNAYRNNSCESHKEKAMKSETIQLSDRGQAATDTNV